MFTAIRYETVRETDALRRQAIQLERDFRSRVLTLLLCLLLATPIAPFQWMAISLIAFFFTEISQDYLRWRLMSGRDGWARAAYIANAFLAASIFSAFPLVIWHSGAGAGHVMGLGMMVTALIHCILVRSHHLGVCLATMAPLLAALAWMVGPPIAGPGAFSASGASLIVVTVYCLVCLGYLIFAAIDQNRVHRGMVDALERAEAANVAKGRFLTAMSHEIRTPLNGILGIAQINLDAATTPRETELAETLLSSGQILKSMVDDILDHAKIEAGKLDLNPEPMDLHHLCRAIMRLYEAGAEEKDLDLVIDIADSVPPMIMADRLRLHQILANLVSNAVKFTPAGEVRIAASAERNPDGSVDLTIAVSDSGKGLSDDEMATLFDAFTQAGNEAELAAKGTGLGLPISRALAGLMDGTLSVASAPGEGACFTLIFQTRIASEATRVAKGRDPDAPPALDGLSVLVAEDNTTNRLILRSFLKDTGIALTEARDGAEAVELVRAESFDLVLLDMRMPVMDGETAFRQIREAGIAIPVIALTANAMAEDRARYLDMGMDDYLSKPLSKTALLRALGRHAARPGGAGIAA